MNNNIKEIRDATGKTQETVAADLGISLSTYRSWEQGSRRLNGEALLMLSSYFDVTTDSILGTVHAEKKYQHKAARTAEQDHLLGVFELLDETGKAKVFDYIDDLILSGKYEKKEVQDYSVQQAASA